MAGLTIEEYNALPYRLELLWKYGTWWIQFPELPGCSAPIRAREDCLVAGDELKRRWLAAALKEQRVVPKPQLTRPRPWRVAPNERVDGPVIIDKNGEEVLGVSEWIRISQEDLELIIKAVNHFRE